MKAIPHVSVALFLTLAAVLSGPARSEADHLSGVKVIDAEQLKTWVDQGKQMLLIDARISSEYRAGHIPTAINIPEPLLEQKREKLPRDRQYPLVFYCNGWPECKKSHDACSKVIGWGYTNVHWFRDGIPVWQSKGFPVE